MAASLALPAMATESAAQLAEAEGLVTHLTSLLLIDEAPSQEVSIPATRKVALPTPRTAAMPVMAAPAMMREGFHSGRGVAPWPPRLAERSERSSGLPISFGENFLALYELYSEALATPSKPQRDRLDGGDLADAIGWDQAPHRLQAGDLADLDPKVARAIRDLAARAEVIELAKKLTLDPLVLVVGLLARMRADRNRSAARIARAIFGKRPRHQVDEAAATAGLA
jgi:hypothetical protein